MYESITQILLSSGIFNKNLTINIGSKSKIKKLPLVRQLIIEHTNFIQYDAPLNVRLHCILKQIYIQPTCQTCHSILKMRLNGIYRYTFAEFCGSKCFSSDYTVINKRKKTNMERHGVDNQASLKQVQEKRKKTNLEKYDPNLSD